MAQQSFLSEAIRSARRRADLSQLQLAELLGIRQSSVSQWERGSTKPSTVHLLALAAVLKASLLDFVAPAANAATTTDATSPNGGTATAKADATSPNGGTATAKADATSPNGGTVIGTAGPDDHTDRTAAGAP
jgi:DNA-binding XRE family transcriptional regulator